MLDQGINLTKTELLAITYFRLPIRGHIWLESRDLSIIGLFLFMIPRIFNTKNDTIQYQKTIPPKNNFF